MLEPQQRQDARRTATERLRSAAVWRLSRAATAGSGWRWRAAKATNELDIRNEERLQDVVDEIVSRSGSLDVLVNNAGIGRGSAVREIAVKAWNEVVESHLRGAFLCSKHTGAGDTRRRRQQDREPRLDVLAVRAAELRPYEAAPVGEVGQGRHEP